MSEGGGRQPGLPAPKPRLAASAARHRRPGQTPRAAAPAASSSPAGTAVSKGWHPVRSGRNKEQGRDPRAAVPARRQGLRETGRSGRPAEPACPRVPRQAAAPCPAAQRPAAGVIGPAPPAQPLLRAPAIVTVRPRPAGLGGRRGRTIERGRAGQARGAAQPCRSVVQRREKAIRIRSKPTRVFGLLTAERWRPSRTRDFVLRGAAIFEHQ